jgi:hypothetical protein
MSWFPSHRDHPGGGSVGLHTCLHGLGTCPYNYNYTELKVRAPSGVV